MIIIYDDDDCDEWFLIEFNLTNIFDLYNPLCVNNSLYIYIIYAMKEDC